MTHILKIERKRQKSKKMKGWSSEKKNERAEGESECEKKVSNNDLHTTNKGLGSQIKAGTCVESRGSVRRHELSLAALQHCKVKQGNTVS